MLKDDSTLSGLVPSISINNQENALYACLQPKLMEAFSLWEFFQNNSSWYKTKQFRKCVAAKEEGKTFSIDSQDSPHPLDSSLRPCEMRNICECKNQTWFTLLVPASPIDPSHIWLDISMMGLRSEIQILNPFLKIHLECNKNKSTSYNFHTIYSGTHFYLMGQK